MTTTLTGNPSLVTPNFDAPASNPLLMLKDWLKEAERLRINEPRSLVLSTVNQSGRPSSRVVFLRDCDDEGIVFATSQVSAKGKDLILNPWAAGTLWWRETLQQINFQGRAIQLSSEKSDDIFQTRTREAQSVAVISQQSAPLVQEEEMRDKFQRHINTTSKIDRPKDWHAYHLAIEAIEFWHGSTDRLHKRLRYDLVNNAWQYQKLQP
ncbi:MAG: pdxH [Alphaproteobacteria bacterium]|jgi:pyridoxamine 5'-phosphate oxidase|nr:pdxH [Alphaproteobacteria bacterium]